MPEPTTSPVALRETRERTIQTLIDHFAQDHLEVTDFEQRLDRAHQATTVADLLSLTSDLPVPASAGGTTAPVTRSATGTATSAPRSVGATLPDGVQRRGNQVIVGIMGGATRRGRWVPAHDNTAVGIMGGVLLDFREAVLPPGETRVHAFAFWGGVSIVVPPGLDVTVNGIGIMGGFDHLGQSAAMPAADAPRLKIDGVALMGGVDVRVRAPGEATGWDTDPDRQARHEARRQLHQRRHELREEARRLREEWRGRR